MDIKILEEKLDKGQSWGFKKELSDPAYLGWIVLKKRKPPIIYPKEAYAENEQERYSSLVRRYESAIQTPYLFLNFELKKEVHESEEYEAPDDYRLNECIYFETLEEVVSHISSLGYSLNDIKHRREIDAP